MSFPLPNPDDPSDPGLPAPLFADVDAVRGDQLRACMQLIWGNFAYLEDNFDAKAILAALTAFAVGANSTILATDTILAAFGKTQGQINALNSGKQATLKVATLSDQKANGTDGGTATGGGRQKRVLNTKADPDSIVTLSANNFTPIAGTYLIIARAPAQDVGRHRIYLYNETAAADVADCAGSNGYTAGGVGRKPTARLSVFLRRTAPTRFRSNTILKITFLQSGLAIAWMTAIRRFTPL